MKKLILPICLLIFGNGIMAQHFQKVWDTPFSPMNVYVTAADLNASPLGLADEIGIFDTDGFGNEICVGVKVLQSPIPEGNFVQIICSMDDGLNAEEPNGFTMGNDFIFRYWINSTDEEITDVMFAFPYPDYDETFNPLGTALVSLSATSQIPQTQSIFLNAGWSGISTWLSPSNPAMEEILSAIQDNLIIIQNLEGSYYKVSANNSLSEWNYNEGYFIKMNSTATIEIQGFFPEANELILQTGWNLIPVLSNQPVNIESLFSGNLDKVEIIKEAIGLEVHWPDKNITTLQSLQVGKSYLIKVSEGFIITF